MAKKIKTVNVLVILAILLVAALLLNPSAERHRTVIKKTIAERSQIDKMFGVGHLTAFASTYHSFWLGSYTTVNDEVQSVGIMGFVMVME